ncbi:MAG: hypothetical protein IJ858_06645 [Acidaminococcaceae bacterium]|nr:hypothetical protein [Acidaminococcaceae bacterium]MBR2183084.1 hypothetical protein [Acidaminococcaceae bacterium]
MKNIDRYLKELGPDYSIQVIDREQVIYHKINDNFDIEVSGLDNNRKAPSIVIFVWQLKPGKQIVETIKDVHTISHLADTLYELRQKYSEKHPG